METLTAKLATLAFLIMGGVAQSHPGGSTATDAMQAPVRIIAIEARLTSCKHRMDATGCTATSVAALQNVNATRMPMDMVNWIGGDTAMRILSGSANSPTGIVRPANERIP